MSDFFATPESTLAAASAGLLAVYFILFFRLVARHPSDRSLLTADSKGTQANLLLAPFAVAAVLVPPPYKVLVLALGFGLLGWLAWQQDRRLVAAGVSGRFLRHHRALSVLAVTGLLAFAASMLLSR